LNQANIEIEILINIIPIIIINSLIAIIAFFVMSFIILSIENRFIHTKIISNGRKKIINLFFGVIIVIFLITNQSIFIQLFKIPELNNINGLVEDSVFRIRDTFFWISVFFIQLFFILAFSLRASTMNSFIPLIFIIPLQFMIPIINIEIFGTTANITKIILFLVWSIIFLLIIRVFSKRRVTIILLSLFFLNLLFFISNLIVDFIFFQTISNLLIFFIILILSSIYFLSSYLVIDNIFRSISRVNFLRQSIIFDNKNFVKNFFSENYFRNWVATNDVNHGFFLLFKLSNEGIVQKILGGKKSKIIYDKVLTLVIKDFNNDFIFLKGVNGEFYFFTKIHNIEKINFKINNLFKKMPKNIIFNREKIPLVFKFYGVEYGKNANHFEDLIDCVSELSKNKGINDNNNLIMYSFSKRNSFTKLDDYKKLNEKIKIDNISVKLIRKEKNWEPKIIINKKSVKDIKDILSEINELEIKQLLIRHIAYLSLEQFYFENGIIKLWFLSSIIESPNFDLNDFLLTINKIGIKYSDIQLIIIDKNIKKDNLNYKNIIRSGIII